MKSLRTRRAGLAAITGLALAAGMSSMPALAETGTGPAAQPAPPEALATSAADEAAAIGLDELKKGPAETFRRVGVTPGAAGLFYVAYERSYQGLPVVGGDAVVVADGEGAVRDTVSADTASITIGTHADVTAERAERTARQQLTTVDSVEAGPELVVLAGDSPKLAYEVLVTGTDAGAPSRLHVFVDARSGAVLDTRDEVKRSALAGAAAAADERPAALGSGNGYYNGNVTIDTTSSGGQYSTRDPNRRGLSCGNYNSRQVFTGSDDNWGNGSGTDLETACVDALYASQTEWDMLGEWLGRDGINGQGGGFPAYVGLNAVNAYWDGSSTSFGHSRDGRRQVTPMDVVGHEYGHAIFQTTPGGAGRGNENGGLNESTGDIFGALTEFYAQNPNDDPDYDVGEEVNLVGSGPIRYMNDPSRAGHPNCYSSSIPNTEVHAAAGPQNHWFYLLAEGSNPGNGMPSSPTCDNSSITGIGIQKAGKIFYNGLLRKTSSWDHRQARVATLESAKTLFPNSCVEFDTVKAAWNAVSVSAVGGEPTCDNQPPVENDFSLSLNPSSVSLEPGESATVTVSTEVTEGDAQAVQLSASGLPSGATASFDPDSVESGGSAVLTIATSANTTEGTSQVTITGDGVDIDHTVQLSLTVGDGGPPPGCDSPAWDSAANYVPGDVVSHAGHEWESTWYSSGAEPGDPRSWAVWSDLGAC
ncbi:M4 family metallopeptidase [Amycolatopsis cihanbeyliensis]|uniref:Zn-dependent metalloprotease n=1 Tax=Amycolatopsis cihanbeyliensis TaxID=1128664 RepID=A0A542DIR5_AMYCI|nr:M4 family metallopeptidase [Amycolatopsis cihanbeyliensis]TQJ02946.1 Zn-dependent metalloprotease [Amycolatopsis cihanbeyliensis]